MVVSNTSPLRALADLGTIDWIEVVFRHVVLPPAVESELRHPPGALPPMDVSIWPFLEVQAPADSAGAAELGALLDPGEAEAIALAEELGAETILVDDLVGREVARRCGFTALGMLGVLVRAKRRGLCDTVAHLLGRLRTEMDFFFSGIRRRILEETAWFRSRGLGVTPR